MLLAALLLVAVTASAQEQSAAPGVAINPYRVVLRSTLHGVMLLNNLDTYLSGYNYTGAGYYFSHETFRNARTCGYNWKFQTVTDASLGYTKLHSSGQLSFLASRSWGGYHPFRINEQLQLLAGMQAQLAGGALYVPANGNNPVSVKLRASLAASGMAIYRFNLAGHGYKARYQLDIPLAGIMFSPQFGQSYYEIFGLGHTDGIVKFAYPVNSPSWRHTLTLDIPLRSNTLRIAYIAHLYQSKVNDIRTHIYSHAFAIGFSKTIYKVKRDDAIEVYSPF